MGPLQLTKYETKGTFLSSLVNWKRFESAALDCIKKNLQYFIFFMNWEKLRSPAKATFKNPKISLWSTAEDLHSKILILNSWFNWEKLCPNLYFTIENMRDELHRCCSHFICIHYLIFYPSRGHVKWEHVK